MSSSPATFPSLDPDAPETYEFAPISPQPAVMDVICRPERRTFSESMMQEIDRTMRLGSPNSGRKLLEDVYRSWQGARTAKPFRFLDLPAELRLQVYDLVLRPGDVFVNCKPRHLQHDVRFSRFLIHRTRSESWPMNETL
ncbi:hypothetical protein B0A48_12538 [Cryoendolithus antarcticus]|uniref:Uncharacterized protein n=1 Tax=Cryoendolithus antarcticus TaxID=1507870 RepID=A0A1V8SSR3_9PEZI|nr:hypothetical protein B0A48_12538 [Cryoendolithus antarcticus]